MNKKRLAFIGTALLLLLAVWTLVNPPGRFGICGFGYTVYGVIPYPASDLQVRCDGASRTVEKIHSLSLEEVKWLLEPPPEVLIIATGWSGVTKVGDGIRKIEGCEVKILETGEARELFNTLKAKGVRVAIHYHSTC